jgi:hypothetical protein
MNFLSKTDTTWKVTFTPRLTDALAGWLVITGWPKAPNVDRWLGQVVAP